MDMGSAFLHCVFADCLLNLEVLAYVGEESLIWWLGKALTVFWEMGGTSLSRAKVSTLLERKGFKVDR